MMLTQWFETCTPSKVGIYEVDPVYGGRAFSYWDGLAFGYLCWLEYNDNSEEETIQNAYESRNFETELKPKYWRGLAENPNKKESE
jgi:hypothetical protein